MLHATAPSGYHGLLPGRALTPTWRNIVQQEIGGSRGEAILVA
jgi:hypothetical protein